MHPEFPFVGAGDASYFEWAEVSAYFSRAPTKAQAAAIAKRVPVPLRDSIDWYGRVLTVASEQGVGRVIKAAYAKSPSKPARLTTQGRFTIAPTSAYARFNADIDAWLIEAHATVPIVVAYRAEDSEAGGTVLSDWHRASVMALPDILRQIALDDEPRAADLGLRLASIAMGAKLRIDAKLVERFERASEAAEEREAEEREAEWEAQKAAASKALGAPQPPYAKRRTDLDAELAKLAKTLPLASKRLMRQAKAGLTVRPGATEAAISAAEKALGCTLGKEHRALLGTFDGGRIGEITILGTAKGGAKGDAELATFSNAWSGAARGYVIVAHTGRDRVIAIGRQEPNDINLLEGTCGWGGGRIVRSSKKLDTLLDLVLKANKV
jgi:hypothetical protein